MKTTTIRMPKVLHECLRQLAKEKGLTLNALVISALWDAVNGKGAAHERFQDKDEAPPSASDTRRGM